MLGVPKFGGSGFLRSESRLCVKGPEDQKSLDLVYSLAETNLNEPIYSYNFFYMDLTNVKFLLKF